jgi:hypothetical protein
VVLAIFWFLGAWLAYAINSDNSSGECCSIRWFVPLLAPGYFLLAVFLRDNQTYALDLMVLNGWGIVLAGLMWWAGPWAEPALATFYPVVATCLLNWGWIWLRRRQTKATKPAIVDASLADAA